MLGVCQRPGTACMLGGGGGEREALRAVQKASWQGVRPRISSLAQDPGLARWHPPPRGPSGGTFRHTLDPGPTTAFAQPPARALLSNPAVPLPMPPGPAPSLAWPGICGGNGVGAACQATALLGGTEPRPSPPGPAADLCLPPAACQVAAARHSLFSELPLYI